MTFTVVYMILILIISKTVFAECWVDPVIFSGRELTFTFAICHRNTVCLSSVTLVHPTQLVDIFGISFHRTIAQGLLVF